MVKRFLITTALEGKIPTNQPLLLLGEWCKPFSKKNKFKNLNIKVLPYHWDDRSKLHRDYLYLDALYEKLLIELTFKLNKIHGTQHKTRYWRNTRRCSIYKKLEQRINCIGETRPATRRYFIHK